MIRKKREPEIKSDPRIFAVGDYVITPISERLGKITKIVETPYRNPHGFIFTSDMHFPKSAKEYTVELNLPCLHIDVFKTVTLLCKDHELKAA